jgi:hypothetical protein
MHPIGWPVDAWKDAETQEPGTRGDGYPVEEAPLTTAIYQIARPRSGSIQQPALSF